MRWVGRRFVATALCAAAVAGCGASADSATPAPASPAVSPSVSPTVRASVAPKSTAASAYPAWAVIARGPKLPVYASADGRQLRSLSNPQEYGAPLTLLLAGGSGKWLRVWLPMRPNGSQGWVRRADVDLAGLPYRLDAHLGKHQLELFSFGRRIQVFPIGVGTTSTPTPGGTYYLTALLKPKNPRGAYGPYAYGLSGFSEVIRSFNGGNGVLGLHGTNDPSSIGRDVSHGCLRMRNADITSLSKLLPLGTPIRLVAS